MVHNASGECPLLAPRKEVLILPREASGKEKEISLPFPPLLSLSQFFSGHLELQTHCSYLAFVGELVELVSVMSSCFPAGFKCLSILFSN